jgi:dolichol-phosphate mannosyltransferase
MSTLQLNAAIGVSFLIPAYNEATTIREVLERIDALRIDHEVVVVDDGSTDDTAAIVAESPTTPRMMGRAMCSSPI